MLTLLVNLFTVPGAVFPVLRERAPWLFPLVLLMVATAAANSLYFTLVDFEYLLDDMVTRASESVEQAQLPEVRKAYEQLGARGLLLTSVVSSSIMIVVFSLLHAGYFALISLFGETRITFKRWLSLVCWTSLPRLLSIFAMMMTVLLAPNGQLLLEDANPLSLRNILGITIGSGVVREMTEGMDLTVIWSLILLTMGYRSWTHRSWALSVGIVLLPVVVLFGGLALVFG